MKWGRSSEKAENKITELVGNFFGAKGLYVMATLILFVLVTGAGFKWRG